MARPEWFNAGMGAKRKKSMRNLRDVNWRDDARFVFKSRNDNGQLWDNAAERYLSKAEIRNLAKYRWWSRYKDVPDELKEPWYIWDRVKEKFVTSAEYKALTRKELLEGKVDFVPYKSKSWDD